MSKILAHGWSKAQVKLFAAQALARHPGIEKLLCDTLVEAVIAKQLILGPLSCSDDLLLTGAAVRALYNDVIAEVKR